MNETELKREDERLRGDFPIFADKDLVYLDSSATTQKPKRVLDAVRDYYEKNNANPLRGLYRLSVAATEAYENARAAVQKFVNAAAPEEIVFTPEYHSRQNQRFQMGCQLHFHQEQE